MQRPSTKGVSGRDSKVVKIHANSSKNKKELKQSSSKNLKTVKGLAHKSHFTTEQSKIKQSTSPDMTDRNRQTDNDYGVNPYFARYKVKTSHKKEAEQVVENTDYGTFNTSKDTLNTTHFDTRVERGSKIKVQESDYAETAFQKIKLPNSRGLINAEGKFVPNQHNNKEHKNQSFHHNSGSKNSFSLNFNSRQESRYRKKKNKSKSKSKKKILDQQKSQEYNMKHKSADKTHSRDYHHSYYQKSRQQHKDKPQKKEKKVKQKTQEYDKIGSINSKATSIGTQTQAYSALCLTQDINFIQKVKDQIAEELKPVSNIIVRKSKFNEIVIRQRSKVLMMLSKICGTFNMKRQIFFLTMHYLDLYISQFSYQNMKLVALGSLTLALKMEDAEMISKFCFHYLYNPEKTVKKTGSNNQMKIKPKRQSVVGKEQGKQVRSKLSGILNLRISQDKKPAKEDYSLEEVLDSQTHIMMKFGFKLMTKTVMYWVDMLTALWDSYVGQFCPKYLDTLIFRNDRSPRNLSYVIQMVELQCLSMGAYGYSKVSLVLAAIYLIVRMALQEKKEQTPWEELCRYYRVSLSKTTNLIFCDGIGINVLFGDFLTLFELSMANIIECIQMFSKYLQPQMIKTFDYRKIEGLNREDRLTAHVYSEELYKYHNI